ncbi:MULTISPECIES: monovalent cation/H(+) antiporter subunit G [Brochothrix]|uniref:Putative non essential component of Na(+)/H(+) antiporter subunit G n=1 Tax=Brochothrix thermosphacta TaxID=2756 RepID=A0A2X0QIH8_BROTH|nr:MULTISPECIES: monovalent cation/H(+) antiporter subunit G [Brochothrix]SLM91534.1 Na(+) H(+) antiporter subunit G [Brachybacterium faecium]ANZ94862.1 hypothetical protein BFC19_05440 [Brochothrix thermosphacta]ANZ96837.1 hypothetical protein BFC20_03350 [Brochothrix thermosphacta]MBR5527320.1 Na+/H+ antiporter subunit G [Brochothrix sp.]MDO7864622.1 monovalent cation/H(+) antiporter subunit G [Brochothrix thermosphacta]
MIELSLEIIISILIILSSILSLIAAIGLIRLPDTYTRAHAAGIGNTLGITIMMLALSLYFTYFSSVNLLPRIILALVFIFLTAPIANHLITRSAYHIGVPLTKKHKIDELYPVKKEEIQALRAERLQREVREEEDYEKVIQLTQLVDAMRDKRLLQHEQEEEEAFQAEIKTPLSPTEELNDDDDDNTN